MSEKGEAPETPEHDFRFFQYSKLALPLLLFTLGIYIALLLLTMWQSKSDIRQLKSGIPRSVELKTADGSTETGVPLYKRNTRIAVFFMGITLVVFALAVFFADMSAVMRARLNYPLGLFIILVGALSWVVFALDVNSERHVIQCKYSSNQSTLCEHREDLGTGCTVFDAFSGLFLVVSGSLLICYTYTGDFCREKMQAEEYEMYANQAHQPGLLRNGVSTVRKHITLLALLAALASCIILAIFTIMVSEDRDQYISKNQYNRELSDVSNTASGWPMKCTKLRYAVCSFAIITIIFNLIPLTSRVIAYLLGFLYLIYATMSFSSFGIDVDAIEQAKNIQCPTGYKCSYSSFNTCVVLDFMGGIMLIIYVIYEYFISKRSKRVEMPQPSVVVA